MNEDKNLEIKIPSLEHMKWYNPLDGWVKFYGFNYIEEDHRYQRFPKVLEEEIRNVSKAVANLSTNSAGGQMHFLTNSSKLVIHAKTKNMAMLSGMTMLAQAGFDCYVGKNYQDLKFYDSARFDLTKNNTANQEYEYTLFNNRGNEEKLVVINFPLYSQVEEVYLAIQEDCYIKKPCVDLSKNNKIVIYGTSMTQGGCASRPGLVYTNILSRKMQCEWVNFGFSGNAFGEATFAKILSDISDATMFVLDYEANAGTNGKLEKTLEEFIRILRQKHPVTPIVVVSRVKYLFDELDVEKGKRREEIRQFQVKLIRKLRKTDSHLYYVDGRKLFGEDYHEYTVDSIHPNDYGFMVLAVNLLKELNKILKKEKKNE